MKVQYRDLPPHVTKAIVCGIVPKVRNWRDLPNSQLTRAERNMRFCEKHLIVPQGSKVGEKIVFDIFQEAFFYSVFDSDVHVETAILSIARKNSKTATIACIVLVFLIGPEAKYNSEIASGAHSKEQAGQVYKYASQMAALSPTIRDLVKATPSSKMLYGVPCKVTYKACSAEAKTSHGGSAYVVIVDEAGQFRGATDEYFDAFTTGQGAYENPLLIIISTQAPSDGDLLSIKIDDARESKDPHIACHVYEAPKDCKIEDEEAWLMANPAMGIFRSKEEIEKQAREAKRMPSKENTFRNLFLNQRIEINAPYVSKAIWEKNSSKLIIPKGAQIWAGLDLSMVIDLTSLEVISNIGGTWAVESNFWLPNANLQDKADQDRVPYIKWRDTGVLYVSDGEVIDFEDVAERLLYYFNNYDVQKIAFDRYKFASLKKDLVRCGFTDEQLEKFLPFGQGFREMSPAMDLLEADLIQGKVAHGDHLVLEWCARNATTIMNPAGDRKLVKTKDRHKKIDGMVALTMARGVANTETKQTPKSFYDNPELSLYN